MPAVARSRRSWRWPARAGMAAGTARVWEAIAMSGATIPLPAAAGDRIAIARRAGDGRAPPVDIAPVFALLCRPSQDQPNRGRPCAPASGGPKEAAQGGQGRIAVRVRRSASSFRASPAANPAGVERKGVRVPYRSLQSIRRSRFWLALVLAVGLAAAAPSTALADNHRDKDDATGGTAPTAGAPAAPKGGSTPTGPAPLTPPPLGPGETAKLLPDGTAQAPASAPEAVKRVIAAGNQIAKLPYRYGGGHALLKDTAYDCSGSVSFALRGAGLMQGALPSTGFYTFGEPGPGRWITIYANGGHMYMVVAGLRFDTSGRAQTGSRWQTARRSSASYKLRHPPGL
jgi:hypothetical protein